jgi:hypothetical protein
MHNALNENSEYLQHIIDSQNMIFINIVVIHKPKVLYNNINLSNNNTNMMYQNYKT